MVFQKANPNEFDRIRAFYWALIDAMAADNDKIGWKKGIYPTDNFLRDGLAKGTLYTLTHRQQLAACVIVNSDTNEGYAGVPWRVDCADGDVLIPHYPGGLPGAAGAGDRQSDGGAGAGFGAACRETGGAAGHFGHQRGGGTAVHRDGVPVCSSQAHVL